MSLKWGGPYGGEKDRDYPGVWEKEPVTRGWGPYFFQGSVGR